MLRASRDTVRKTLPAIAYGLASIAALALIALALAGPLYRFGFFEFGQSVTLMRYTAWAGVLMLLLAIVPLGLALYLGGVMRAAVACLLAMVLGIATAWVPFNWQQTARSVPPIHDISTDTRNPPAFRAIAPLRANAPNPVAYAGEETAEQQKEAYPDIETLRFQRPAEDVLDASVTVSQAMGWELVSVDADNGYLEATATTPWFGFKDDVVIRIRATAEGSELDIRSKSRIGGSDLGTNAERIRTFRDQLEKRLGD